jgi:hypothetical protein
MYYFMLGFTYFQNRKCHSAKNYYGSMEYVKMQYTSANITKERCKE